MLQTTPQCHDLEVRMKHIVLQGILSFFNGGVFLIYRTLIPTTFLINIQMAVLATKTFASCRSRNPKSFLLICISASYIPSYPLTPAKQFYLLTTSSKCYYLLKEYRSDINIDPKTSMQPCAKNSGQQCSGAGGCARADRDVRLCNAIATREVRILSSMALKQQQFSKESNHLFHAQIGIITQTCFNDNQIE